MTELEPGNRQGSGRWWRPRWSRDRRWVLGVVIVVVGLAAAVEGARRFNVGLNPDGTGTSTAPGYAFLVLVGYALIVVGVLVFLRGLWWRWRTWPQAQRARADARLLYELLRSDVALTPLHAGAAVLRPGETAHLALPLQYSRLTSAGDGSYSHMTAFGTGSIGIGVMAGSMIGNSRRRAAAAAAAQRCWREHQVVRATVTDQRIICPTQHGHLSFYWSAVTAFFPDVPGCAVILEFDGAVPLRLAGRGAELLAVYATRQLRPAHEFNTSPSLAQLR